MKIDTQSLKAMAANPSGADPATVAREFEALLVAEVWKRAAGQSLGASKLLSGGSSGQMYREMLVEEVVRRAVDAGGFGLGAQIAQQIAVPEDASARRVDPHESPPPEGDPDA
ncbi:MAG: hypothetical protein HKP30_16295 [Myxococcales bacterium]|nr:hypothetical protein [Myxococcales bacterium]